MKKIFVGVAALLALAYMGLMLTEPSSKSAVPIIYWVIDPAPARGEQIHLYHMWLIKNGYCTKQTLTTDAELKTFQSQSWSVAMQRAIREATPDGAAALDRDTTAADLPLEVAVPGAEMRLDAASNDLNKKVVQGVSGVAGDVIEAYSGGVQMSYLASAGMLADVTESAKTYGFGPEKTFKALRPALFYNGRQYAFPRNPAQTLYWVNKATFTAHGQALPPQRWTIDEFEERGKAFVKAANPAGGRQTVFFADRALVVELRRSMGLSMFNETLTRCNLDDPRNVALMARIHKWTFTDHILPSAADLSSFDTQGGWRAHSFQLFKGGRFGLLASGRWALMLFRQFGTMPLDVVEPPHGGLPNTILSGGQSTVYTRSRHPKYAELFLAYMADEDYNMQIVRDGDALPPNPKYVETEAFKRPPDYPNEWGCHEVFAETALTIAITQSLSPFVLPVIVERIDQEAQELVMNDRAAPEEAARDAAVRVHAEIQRGLEDQASLKQQYEEWSTIQQQIDAYRKEGRKVPLDWLKNPYHRRLYQVNGWCTDGGAE